MDSVRKQQITEKRRRLNQQIQEAQAELAKLDQYEALDREIFSGTEEEPSISRAQSPADRMGVAVVQGFGRMTKKETILSTVAQILSDGKRRSSKELHEELKARGVDVGGQDPVNNLAAYLSPDDRFDSKRAEGGWGLIRVPHHVSGDPLLS